MDSTESVQKEIASFYEDPAEALELLTGSFGPATLELAIKLLYSERVLFEKRKRNGIVRQVGLLKIALDPTPAPTTPTRGSSLGFPAYQAEAYYQGFLD